MNKILISEFNKLIQQTRDKIAEEPKNRFKLRFFILARDIFKNHPKKIKSSKDLEEYQGIGKGIKKRVDEILQTGKLSEINLPINKKQDTIRELTQVINIGRVLAKKLVEKHKVKSVKDLIKRKKELKLNDQILLGLKYYNKVKRDIPRKEIQDIEKYLQNINNTVTIAGSYRRKSKTSNDIDVLISKDFKKFINKLNKDKFLIDHMTDLDNDTKYMGFCKFKNKPIRRIDIRYVKPNEYPAALLYFTGSKNHNQKMRGIAKSKGMKLNEYGLYKNNKKLPTKSEEDIFKLLGMKYIKPEHRI